MNFHIFFRPTRTQLLNILKNLASLVLLYLSLTYFGVGHWHAGFLSGVSTVTAFVLAFAAFEEGS